MRWNMKKVAGALFSCILAGALLSGCGSSGQKGGSSAANAPLRVGVIKNLNVSEEQRVELMKQAAQRAGASPARPFSFTYYDSLTSMMLGLKSKSIDEVSTYKSVASYLLAQNADLGLTDFTKAKLTDSFCCALLESNRELIASMNDAISSMKEDGTLDRLTKEYITDIQPGQSPPAVDIQKIEGAESLRVAVTGDLPPIDLILPDGTPAGFNTAVLAELGKRLNKNIELVSVESGARAAALSSHRVDVVFWAVVPADSFNIRPANIDKPEGIETTAPYYQDDIVHVAAQK